MNCRDIARLLAESMPFPKAAEEHVRTCERCRLLVVSPPPYLEPVTVDAALEQRLIEGLTKNLAAMRPLSSSWVYSAALAAIVAVVVAAGVGMLGVRGWLATSIFQKLYFLALLGTGITACTMALPQLMFPGALPRIRTWVLAALATAGVLAAGLLYPVLHYPHFGRAVITCFTIGTVHAAVLSTAAVFLLRRGLVLSRRAAAAITGMLGGFTGLFVLFVFCPHLDAGHYLLAHATVVLACTALGPAILALVDRHPEN